MRYCTNSCARPPFGSPNSPYDEGWRYCAGCEKAVKYDGLYCPCCCGRLRTRSRTRAARTRRQAQATR